MLHQPFRPEALFVGFPMDSETQFFSASLRQCVPIGGGFWQVGVEFLEVINPAAWERQIQLEALVARLVPRSNSKNLPTADTLR